MRITRKIYGMDLKDTIMDQRFLDKLTVDDWLGLIEERFRSITSGIKDSKAICFVQHIQNHLDNFEDQDPSMKKGRKIPPGKVGCKICERSIDQIWTGRNL